MKTRTIAGRMLAGTLLSATMLPAWGDSIDNFENGLNPNGWSFQVSAPDTLPPFGGNPGGWLHNPAMTVFIPTLTADLRNLPFDAPLLTAFMKQEVRRVKIDARTLVSSDSFWGPQRPFVLMLRSTKRTADPADDDFVYKLGPAAPAPGLGWQRYEFDVPGSFAGQLPPGWIGGSLNDFEHLRPGVTWASVLRGVDMIHVLWADPRLFYLLQNYDAGVDNVIVETSAATPGK